ncbi:MAG: sigma-70 family RNA polymerase sigma factor [Methylococcales bacterium]
MVTNNSGHLNRDADLIARICNMDEKALELLYQHYYTRLFRFIARITRKEELIGEVINDVMYVVWEKADTYNQQCQPSTWIFGIAYNKARQSLRNSGHKDEESLDELDGDNLVFAENNCALNQLEVSNWLEPALDMLSPDQRAVIELTYFEGLHYSEIAILMDCPENTVKTRMYHARKKLAVFLKEND